MATTSRKVALSFLAHPDDAEILCAGTLIRLKQSGYEVHLCTMTPGDCGTVDRTRWDISAIRTNEGKAAAALIGATFHCLDERDGFVVYDKPTIRKTMDLFRVIAPSLVFTHAPKDYMIDHEQTSLLARAGSFMYGAPNISECARVQGSAVPHLYYCDPIEALDPFGNPVTPTTLIDISDVMETKGRMLAAHASQREWLRAHHGMDEYLEAMKRHGEIRGKELGTKYAEAFIQHRGHAYPRNDLLKELFS
jgi:LmbE family N-acetylglucosaminyl deacetylase